MVKVRLNSTGAASRLAALLLAQILPVFSLVAPCHPGASPPSVRRRTFTTDCWPRRRRASLFFLRRWFEPADGGVRELAGPQLQPPVRDRLLEDLEPLVRHRHEKQAQEE